MANFLFTCPTNQFYAGRKYFTLGTIYDHMPSKSDAQAAISCPVPSPDPGPLGPWRPPYAWLRGIPDSDGKDNTTCSRVILWPRVIKLSGSYSEGIDSYHVYSCDHKKDDRENPGGGQPADDTSSLPGDLVTVLSPPTITLADNSGVNAIQIRESETGDYDKLIKCVDIGETSHWLSGTDEWPDILASMFAKDYARDNVPHAAGLFFTTCRWKYLCIESGGHNAHQYVFSDITQCNVMGGCFFLEDLSALFSS